MISFSPVRRVCRAATVLLFAVFLLPEAHAELIPPARLTDWTPNVKTGVIGGIPTNRTRLRNVTQAPYSADNTGATDARAAIQAAIDAAATGDVVYLPAGTYRIEGTLSLGTNFSGKTLRGAGPSVTTIDQRANVGINIGSPSGLGNPNPRVLVTGGLSKGSTTVTINGIPSDWASNYEVGKIIVFNVENDLNVPVVSVYNYNVFTDNGPTNQAVRITGRTPTTLTFSPPLHDAYGGGSLQVRVAYAVFHATGIGLEDLTVDAANYNGGTAFNCVQLNNTFGSWVKNCVIRKAKNYNLIMANALNCEVRHSAINGSQQSGTNGAGLLVNSYSCLYEDNIILDSWPLVEVNSGSSGNVFAYNYSSNGMWETNHAPHNQFNLYEGNAGGYLMSDGYFGGEANITVFRNYLPQGTLHFRRWTRNASAVGNLLQATIGDDGYPNMGNVDFTGTARPSASSYWRDWQMSGELTARTDDNAGTITLVSGSLYSPGQVIRLVWGAAKDQSRFATPTSVSGNVVQIGNYSGGTALPPTGTAISIGPGAFYAGPGIGSYQEKDLDVAATTIKKGNRYLHDNSFDSLGGDTLPNSLFRSSKPSWFKDLVWPPFDPVTPRTPNIEHIPAGYRFVHGVDPPGNVPQGPSNLTAPGAPGAGDRPQGGSPAPKAKAEGSAKPQVLTAKETEKADTAGDVAKASPTPSPKAEKPKRKTTRKKSGGS